MKTVKQLAALTPKSVRERAYHLKVTTLRDKRDRSGDYRNIYARGALGNEESSGDRYSMTVRCHGTKKNPTEFILRPESLVWVHCSCPYFTYYLETCLQLYGSSEIKSSNGQFPKIRNPSLRPYLCKHLFALMEVVLRKDKRKAKY